MTDKTVTVRNTYTGQVATIPVRWFNNPAIINREVITEVEPDAKPFAKETYKPRKVSEFEKSRKKLEKKKVEPETDNLEDTE